MNNNPFFSVVLPTLNRASYLPLAIQSVLNQTFGDFELIVSDNSSSDNTEQVVKRFSDDRIRYVKTKEVLPMHDSWEFALTHARGEFITFLGDDDAHSCIYLESLLEPIQNENAEIVACKFAKYIYNPVKLFGRKIPANTLKIEPFTGKVCTYDSKDALRELFSFAGLSAPLGLSPFGIPQTINAVYHNTIFSKLRNRLSFIFPNLLSGDYYTAVTILSLVQNYHFLDLPLALHGLSKVSTTSVTTAQEIKKLAETNPLYNPAQRVPLKSIVPSNQVAETILQARHDLGNDLDFIQLNWEGYYRRCFREILDFETDGLDTTQEITDFFTTLDAEDKFLSDELRKVNSSIKTKLKILLKKTFRSTIIEKFYRKLYSGETNRYIQGGAGTFENITECAKFINKNFILSNKQG